MSNETYCHNTQYVPDTRLSSDPRYKTYFISCVLIALLYCQELSVQYVLLSNIAPYTAKIPFQRNWEIRGDQELSRVLLVNFTAAKLPPWKPDTVI